jgi:hypothetical protein
MDSYNIKLKLYIYVWKIRKVEGMKIKRKKA